MVSENFVAVTLYSNLKRVGSGSRVGESDSLTVATQHRIGNAETFVGAFSRVVINHAQILLPGRLAQVLSKSKIGIATRMLPILSKSLMLLSIHMQFDSTRRRGLKCLYFEVQKRLSVAHIMKGEVFFG